MDADMPKLPQPTARTQDSILGNVRVITEPLKNGSEKEPEDKSTPGLWVFASLFGAKKEEVERSEESSTFSDSPSLSSSLNSSEHGENADARSEVSISSAVRKLKFNEQVEVCLIPKKEEYSKRIRGHLWNSPEEMALNAHRNTVEFAAEGWDWRNVMEDENMYRCLATNELIHPVHIEQPSP